MNPNYRKVNAATQRGTAGSVFEHYRALIALRHAEPAVALGDFRMVLDDHPSIFAFIRAHNANGLLVLVNLSGETSMVGETCLDGWEASELLLGNYDTPAIPESPGRYLRPWEALVLRRTLVGPDAVSDR